MDAEDRTRDEAELRALLSALSKAWASGDADAYSAQFAPDARYVAYDGTRMRGRQAIAAAHRPLFERFLRGSSLQWDEVDYDFAAPDLVVIHTRGTVRKRSQLRASRRRQSVQTLVAVRRDNRFCLVAFQNTRYRPFAQTLLGKLIARFGDDAASTSAQPAA